MQFHQLKPKHRKKERKRIGRGGKKGASSGFGIGKKGASQPRIREVLKRYPKLRGYRVKRGRIIQVINLDVLEKEFQSGDTINPEVLLGKRILHRIEGRIPHVKILGSGSVAKSFTIEKCILSNGAKIKIEKAGGKIV